MHRKPVIAIAGLSCETSAFSPARTRLEAFFPVRGDEVFTRYPFLAPGTTLGDAADWRCILTAYALPGGIVTRDAFEAIAEEITSKLTELSKKEHIDGFWYDIHGAMVVEDLLDVEAELLQRIRAVIGSEVVVSTSMDLHGNVSYDLAHRSDLITCYRTAPHVDVRETKERACCNLVDLLDRRFEGSPLSDSPLLPLKTWIPIPILLSGEQTSTRLAPAKHIYEAVPIIAANDNIIDAAVWIGYAWADEPRNRAAVVVTGWDRDVVSKGAEKLAAMFWDARAEFDFVAPTASLNECLEKALKSDKKPFFISDMGDNPTAGASGDVTWTLDKLLARSEFKDSNGPQVIYASLPGPKAVQTTVEAGIGKIVTVTAGAEVDDVHSGPITMTGRVHAIKKGDTTAKIEVVLQVGSVFVILTQLRKPYHLERDYTELSLKPREADIVIVKIGYLEPELYDMAADWIMALTPGGVDQDIERLGQLHKYIHRPMWPYDRVFLEPPDLRARIVPPSSE